MLSIPYNVVHESNSAHLLLTKECANPLQSFRNTGNTHDTLILTSEIHSGSAHAYMCERMRICVHAYVYHLIYKEYKE